MKLSPPAPAEAFEAEDIYGNPLSLSDFTGKKVMLCFFRDATCPFCNFRLYELTHRYKTWKSQGVEVIAVFSSSNADVLAHVARYPRPFRMIADPELAIYNRYGVEKSISALWKAFLFKLPTFIRGLFHGGRPSSDQHGTLVPADFLIDAQGQIEDCWYGRDVSDHIPLERVDAFVQDKSPVMCAT
jgi:peroxiredoxin